MKKLFVIASLAAAFSAPQAFAQTKNFEGFSLTGNVNLTAGTTAISGGSTQFDAIGQQGNNASLQAAYSFAVSEGMLISVGASYDLGDVVSGHIVSQSVDEKLALKNRMSVYLEPGFMLNSTNLAYAKTSYNKGSGNIDSASDSGSIDLKGTGFGFGVRSLVSKNLFLQVEVNRIQFGEEDVSGAKLKTGATMGSFGVGYIF